MGVSENRLQSRIFGAMRKEVTKYRENSTNEELQKCVRLHSFPNIISVIKPKRIR